MNMKQRHPSKCRISGPWQYHLILRRVISLNIEHVEYLYSNLWDNMKALLRGQFIALSAHVEKNGEISHQRHNSAAESSRKKSSRLTQVVELIHHPGNMTFSETTKGKGMTITIWEIIMHFYLTGIETGVLKPFKFISYGRQVSFQHFLSSSQCRYIKFIREDH